MIILMSLVAGFFYFLGRKSGKKSNQFLFKTVFKGISLAQLMIDEGRIDEARNVLADTNHMFPDTITPSQTEADSENRTGS
jgi:hypothetical protein